ncbi:unnamed protein product [Closterium sp. Yama58-4]|nr:unnamed protein product [Closterium sp. Yama58-4]
MASMVASAGLTAAGLLFLALTLVAVVQTMKATYGDGTVSRMMYRRSLVTSSGPTGGAAGGGSVGSTSGAKGSAECLALGCGPDRHCEADQNGELVCQWDSPCGTCPTGATCETTPTNDDSSVLAPYCLCPEGYGMTDTECVEGVDSTVSSISFTLIANRTATDNASKPYTLRWNLDGCTQYPEEVAGKFTTIYTVWNTTNTPACQDATLYSTDNCEGTTIPTTYLDFSPKPFSALALLDMNTPGPIRSVMCFPPDV